MLYESDYQKKRRKRRERIENILWVAILAGLAVLINIAAWGLYADGVLR